MNGGDSDESSDDMSDEDLTNESEGESDSDDSDEGGSGSEGESDNDSDGLIENDDSESSDEGSGEVGSNNLADFGAPGLFKGERAMNLTKLLQTTATSTTLN